MGQRSTQHFIDPLRVARRHNLTPGSLASVRYCGPIGELSQGQVVRINAVFWRDLNPRANDKPEIVAEVELKWKTLPTATSQIRVPMFWLKPVYPR